jgi:hypothetical protein
MMGTKEPRTAETDRHEARVSIEGPATLLLALASGQLALDDAAQAGVVIRGDHRALQVLLT